ncbi:undecaprenyl-diphosphatase [Paenibacillus silviterrae]|uniref:undecaprenyl-diphosphatase n=1 Tax=Paenibacillus silviterrae TaxID=3242194 RepID=UPI002543812F|nr:undecaprenyl-diphosphatase [Paenibacillus chinjuensis]
MALSEWNIQLFRWMNDLGKQYEKLNPAMIFIAERLVFFLVIGMIVLWFSRDKLNRMMVVCGVMTFALAELLGKAAGMIHSHHQPFAELPDVNRLIEKAVDNSFPSDHTILFFSFAATFWLFRRKSGVIWLGIAFLVGFSRIWVGVHYPVDVLAGAVISVVSALIVYYAIPKVGWVNGLVMSYDKGESQSR